MPILRIQLKQCLDESLWNPKLIFEKNSCEMNTEEETEFKANWREEMISIKYK